MCFIREVQKTLEGVWGSEAGKERQLGKDVLSSQLPLWGTGL